MRFILRLALILLIALIAYNYFFGDQTERADSERVVESIQELGSSVVGLVVSEKERFSEGKYDEIVDKIGNSIGLLRARKDDLNLTDEELGILEMEKAEIDSMVQQIDSSGNSQLETEDAVEKVNLKIRELVDKLKTLSSE